MDTVWWAPIGDPPYERVGDRNCESAKAGAPMVRGWRRKRETDRKRAVGWARLFSARVPFAFSPIFALSQFLTGLTESQIGEGGRGREDRSMSELHFDETWPLYREVLKERDAARAELDTLRLMALEVMRERDQARALVQ